MRTHTVLILPALHTASCCFPEKWCVVVFCQVEHNACDCHNSEQRLTCMNIPSLVWTSPHLYEHPSLVWTAPHLYEQPLPCMNIPSLVWTSPHLYEQPLTCMNSPSLVWTSPHLYEQPLTCMKKSQLLSTADAPRFSFSSVMNNAAEHKNNRRK